MGWAREGPDRGRVLLQRKEGEVGIEGTSNSPRRAAPTGGGARFSLTSEKTHLTGHLPLSGQSAAGDKDFEAFGAASSGHVPGVAGTARCPVGCLRGS